MSGTVEYDLTANFGLKKPWDDADDDVWGPHMNENMDLIDNLLVTRGFDASKYLPLTGGTITGSLTVDGELTTGGDTFIGGTLWAEGAVNVTDVLTADDVLNVNGVLNAFDALNVHGAMTASGALTVGGVLTADGTVNVQGVLNALNTLNVTGLTTISGNTQIGTTANAGFMLDVVGRSRFVIDSTSTQLTLTSNAATAVTPLSNTHLQVIGADGVNPRIEFDAFGGSGQISFKKAAGTGAAPGASSAGIGVLNYFGHDGTAWTSPRAGLACNAVGTWSPTSTPTYFSWNVTAVGSIVQAEAMRLQASGNLTLGSTVDAGFKLDVVGTGRFSDLVTFSNGATVTGASLVAGSNTAQFPLGINGPAGSPRSLQILTAGVARWSFTATGTAETGASVGSDLHIVARDDTGVAINPNPAIKIARATVNVIVGGSTDAGFRLDVVGTGRYSGALTLSAGGAFTGTFSGAHTYSGLLTLSAGATVAGTLNVTGGAVNIGTNGSTQLLAINGPAASARAMRFQTAGVVRWQVGANVTAEAGSNAGSDYEINSYTDAGVLIATAMRITRSTGNTTFGGAIATAALLTNAANDAAAASAGVPLNQFYRNGSVVMQRAA
jgi:hypothetical protein